MKKEELEQQIADAIAVAQRLGEENKRLKTENDTLIASNTQLKEDFESAVERVRYLAEQIKMVDAQKKASTQFNDRERNY